VANSPQARKRARQAENRRQRNVGMRSAMRTQVKRVVKAVEAGDKASAESAYKAAVPALDRVVGKGIIKSNKAARHKSRLNARIKAMS
jgi:small subunit ribosomal protein S20